MAKYSTLGCAIQLLVVLTRNAYFEKSRGRVVLKPRVIQKSDSFQDGGDPAMTKFSSIHGMQGVIRLLKRRVIQSDRLQLGLDASSDGIGIGKILVSPKPVLTLEIACLP